MNQKQTEEFLRNLSGAIEDILMEATGEKQGFTILIFPFNPEKGKDRVNYISNANREDMIGVLRSTLLRWETGSDDPVNGKINPTTN